LGIGHREKAEGVRFKVSGFPPQADQEIKEKKLKPEH
jgi:hypothetical protein